MAGTYTEVTTHVELDEGPRNRMTVFFRLILVIPAAILLSALTSSSSSSSAEQNGGWHWNSTMPVPFAALVLLLVFMQRYPSWILSFVHAVQSFATRVATYALLLRDEYPHIDERPYAYVLYPDVQEGRALNRWLPLVKWLLAIPHYIVLFFGGIAVAVTTVIAWFAILITGRYPASLAKTSLWFVTYANRVYGYAFALVTDSYPRIGA